MIESPVRTEFPEELRWSGHTDRGRIRQNNEDAFLCLQFDAQEVRYLGKIGDAFTRDVDFLFAVSDGMGGAKAGEFASRIAVDKITRLLPRSFKQSATGLTTAFEDVLEELYQEIHRALTYLGSSDPDCAGMGATLSLCWFTPGWMYFGHIGDSRIYYLPAGENQVRQLTHDDTHVGWLLRNKHITEWQARTHPGRNSLQKALGAGHQFVDPQVGAVAPERGDIFLLCTDGLVDGIFDSQLPDHLRSSLPVDQRAAHLVNTAVAQSGRDNTTALVIEVL
jgi:serine/threonine protein phosphatase PrpC